LVIILVWIRTKICTKQVLRVCSSVKLKNKNKVITVYLNNPSDLGVFREIFYNEEYKLDLKDPKIIFDLGSNIGLSIIYFHLKYPNAKIYGFEPDPRAFKSLEKNTKNLNGVCIFNFALSDKNEKQKFYAHSEYTASSSFTKREDDNDYIMIDSKTLDTIMLDSSIKYIDLLKFDIEGGEEAVFKSFKNIKNVKNIIGEVHLDLMDIPKDDFIALFDGSEINTDWQTKNRFIFKSTK
ncbi:FkbM family methyltransferase, partial [Patescibacteria group bacterium]